MSEQLRFLGEIWPALLQGLQMSMYLSAGSLFLGLAVGLPLALAKTYGGRLLGLVATVYIEIVRGTPMVVQLLIVYFGLPEIGLVINRVPAAIIALAINSSAYQAEYFRGAILSISEGQFAAAQAIGMSKLQAVVHVILPQALRIVIPPWSNEMVYMVKYTSVAFVIAVPELMAQGQMIITRTFRPMETLFWVGIVYVVVLSILAKIVDLIEARFRIPGFQMERES